MPWWMLATLALGVGLGAARAQTTSSTAAPWKADARQSTGGKLVDMAGGVQAVVLDASCVPQGKNGVGIEWTAPAPMPPGWWHGRLDMAVREGVEKSYVNTAFGLAMMSAHKPLVSFMDNFRYHGGDPQHFDFWIYTSQPSQGIRLQPVYSPLWRYKRTWPVTSISLEGTTPKTLEESDPITLALNVEKDGSTALPMSLPTGLWTLSGNMSRPGEMICQTEDGKQIVEPFIFDKWKRPLALTIYLDSRLRTLSFKTDRPPTHVELRHTLIREGKPIKTEEGSLISVVDPGKTESAELQLIGTGLSGEAPTLALVPAGKKYIITTSWDDGEKTDLRCAEILNKHGYRSSFFMNAKSPALAFLDKLEALNVEIGSHCYIHESLSKMPPSRAVEECVEMRKLLEQKLGHPVISMAYPNGYAPAYDVHGNYVLRAMRAAGYWSGRTTWAGSLTVESATTPLTLATDGFFGDRKGLEKAWKKTKMVPGGIFYFWGHSWQIGKTEDKWKEFEEFVAQFSGQPDAWYASQGQLSLWLWARQNIHFKTLHQDPSKVTLTVSRPWLHPYLEKELPVSLVLPAGVQKVFWQGSEVPISDGRVDLTWTSPQPAPQQW